MIILDNNRNKAIGFRNLILDNAGIWRLKPGELLGEAMFSVAAYEDNSLSNMQDASATAEYSSSTEVKTQKQDMEYGRS